MTPSPALRPAHALSLVLSAALLLAAGPTAAPAQQDAPSHDPPEPAGPAAVAAPEHPPQQSYLGVVLGDVAEEDVERLGLPEQRGALVREVADGSPADSAGLQSGDVILEWRGDAVFSAAELARLVRETPPGRQVGVTVYRDGGRTDLSVTLRERHGPRGFFPGSGFHVRGELPPEAQARLRERIERAREQRGDARDRLEHLDERLEELEWDRDGAGDSVSVRRFRFAPTFDGDRARLGVRLQSLTPQLAEYFGLGQRSGVLVASVRDGSPADGAGLQAGDVLLSVAGEDVSDASDAALAVREASGEVEIRVLRRGEERTLTARLPERGDDEDAAPGAG